MRRIEGFSRRAGWTIRDFKPRSLDVLVGAKLSVGGLGADRKLHRHLPGETELFLVLSGTAKAVVEGREIALGIGHGDTDFLLIEDEEHGIFEKSTDFRCAIIFLKKDDRDVSTSADSETTKREESD